MCNLYSNTILFRLKLNVSFTQLTLCKCLSCISNKMEPKKARYVWGDREEKALLDAWEKKLPDLRKAKRNSHIFADISKILASKGVVADAAEISNKIRNLTCKYRHEKKKMANGDGPPLTLKNFYRLDSIIESLSSNNLEICKEEFVFLDSMSDESATSCIPDEMKTQKARHVWGESEEKALLDVWEEKLPELRKAKRNGHIFAEISRILARRGVVADAAEISNKIRNLSSRYRTEKKKIANGYGSLLPFRHFHRVETIIGSFPCNSLVHCKEEFVYNNQHQSSQSQLSGMFSPVKSPRSMSPTILSLPLKSSPPTSPITNSPPLISQLDISLPLKTSPPSSPLSTSQTFMSPRTLSPTFKTSPPSTSAPISPLAIWLPLTSPPAKPPQNSPPPLIYTSAISQPPIPSTANSSSSAKPESVSASTADGQDKKRNRNVLAPILQELKEANMLAREALEIDKKFLDLLQKIADR